MRKYLKLLDPSSYILIFLLLIILFSVCYYSLEDDWLEIKKVNEITQMVGDDRTLKFERSISASKNISINIQRRIINVDTNAKYGLPDVRYTPAIYASGNSEVTFYVILPKEIPAGEYVYYPHAFYNINKIKETSKMLPTERFIIK